MESEGCVAWNNFLGKSAGLGDRVDDPNVVRQF
jgi:hypothetical protein